MLNNIALYFNFLLVLSFFHNHLQITNSIRTYISTLVLDSSKNSTLHVYTPTPQI